MIYFLYGKDTYRSKRKLEEIIAHYNEVHKSGLNLRFFDGKDFSYQDFINEFKQTPMFQEKKMLIFKNIFGNQEFKDSFLEGGEKFVGLKDIIIFQEENEISSDKDSLFKFLIKNAKSQEFQCLEGVKLKNWAKKEFDGYKAEIQPEALLKLVDYIGNDLWHLSNEIQKLSAFKACLPAGRNKIIEGKDIDFLVRPEIETDIFKTVEALASGDKNKALRLVHEHLEKGDNPLYLLSMINFQFRNILIIKETGKLSGHPYFVRKTAFLAQNFAREELRKIYRKVFETDLKIKTGLSDPQTALDLLITEI